jgi:hypothetical protein
VSLFRMCFLGASVSGVNSLRNESGVSARKYSAGAALGAFHVWIQTSYPAVGLPVRGRQCYLRAMASLPVPPVDRGKTTPAASRKDLCEKCGKPLEHWYFRVNGAMRCLECAKSERNMAPRDSEAAYTRAVLFGGGVAVPVFFLYVVLGITTTWVFEYSAIVLGLVIAKMMMVGSKGIGGRRYQWTAVILTYATVSVAAVPIAIDYQSRVNAAIQAQAKAVNLAEEQQRLEEEFRSGASRSMSSAGQAGTAPKSPGQRSTDGSGGAARARTNRVVTPPVVTPAAAFGSLVILGLFSPLLQLAMPIQGGISLISLILGIVIAWRVTAAKRMEITGPFRT